MAEKLAWNTATDEIVQQPLFPYRKCSMTDLFLTTPEIIRPAPLLAAG
ncbi:hypothetical protein GJ700_06315 [Duganella sp. FT92W]|uniref:Uncharacterized protein n=1 Tax=Pseudoduganella rivuli TaxID=2666085 RepID=A0A7X2IKV5_9BURK|nr:hypothetical protein [Pseudoduganella rivuli]MRV71333.1 hypothetical protein [Pseudoduganella rivuli]